MERVKVPLETVVDHLRRRLSEVEYENVVLRAQVEIFQNGLVEVSEADPPVPLPGKGTMKEPASDKLSHTQNDGDTQSS